MMILAPRHHPPSSATVARQSNTSRIIRRPLATGVSDRKLAASVTTPRTCEELLQLIREGISRQIEVSGVPLSHEDIHLIAVELDKRKDDPMGFTMFRLIRCEIDDVKLAELLPRLPRTLRSLSLVWNPLTDLSLEPIVRCIETQCPELFELDLYGSSSISNVKPFLELKHGRLRTISLGGTRINDIDKNRLRNRLRVLHSNRTRTMLAIMSAHHSRVGKDSTLRALPRELLREVTAALFTPESDPSARCHVQ